MRRARRTHPNHRICDRFGARPTRPPIFRGSQIRAAGPPARLPRLVSQCKLAQPRRSIDLRFDLSAHSRTRLRSRRSARFRLQALFCSLPRTSTRQFRPGLRPSVPYGRALACESTEFLAHYLSDLHESIRHIRQRSSRHESRMSVLQTSQTVLTGSAHPNVFSAKGTTRCHRHATGRDRLIEAHERLGG